MTSKIRMVFKNENGEFLFHKIIKTQKIIDDKYLNKLTSYDKTCVCLWRPIIVKLTDIRKANDLHYEFLIQGKQGKTQISLFVLSQHTKRIDHDIREDLIGNNQLIKLNTFTCTKIISKDPDKDDYVIITLAEFEYVPF